MIQRTVIPDSYFKADSMNSVSLHSLLLNVFIFKFKNVKEKATRLFCLLLSAFLSILLRCFHPLLSSLGKDFSRGLAWEGLNTKYIQWMQDTQRFGPLLYGRFQSG